MKLLIRHHNWAAKKEKVQARCEGRKGEGGREGGRKNGGEKEGEEVRKGKERRMVGRDGEKGEVESRKEKARERGG